MNEFKIYVGTQHDGATFQLGPLSRRWLQEQGQELGAHSVFIARDMDGPFDEVWAPMAPQIASLLTGLRYEELSQLGVVHFFLPAEGATLLSVDFQSDVLERHG